MLKALYDEEYLLELHINSRIRENTEKVTKEVTKLARATARQQ